MIRMTLAAMAMTAAMATVDTATAQSLCSERAKFIEHLDKSYREAPTAMGLASNGSVVEVLTSEKGTWTIIVTSPQGTSCVVAAGEAWEAIPVVAQAKPAA